MMNILLLQTASKTITVTEGILPAVYGTLVAAILSLAASIYATVTTSKTQQKVADLQTKTAQELKDKDYRNDFYKKIIERRFESWKKFEILHQILAKGYIHDSDGNRFPGYFGNIDEISALSDMMFSLTSETFWMGKEYGIYFSILHVRLIDIMKECAVSINPNYTMNVDEYLLIAAGKKYFNELNVLSAKLITMSGKQIRNFHDIESFFNELESVGLTDH